MTRGDIDRLIVASAIIFSGRTVDEVRFKLTAYRTLLRTDIGDEEDGTIDVHQILAAIEDSAGYWGEDRIRNLVQTLHLLERKSDADGIYVRRQRIVLEEVTGEIYRGLGTTVSTDFLEQFSKPEGARSVGLAKIKASLERCHAQAPLICAASQGRLPSPFFTFTPGGALTPFTVNRSLTAACDQFGMFVEVGDFCANLAASVDPLLRRKMDRMMEDAAAFALPLSDPFGDGGALALIGQDEDYPGGDRPAVPSNALFVISARLGSLTAPPNVVPVYAQQVAGAVKFLLRMQLESGLWGVYRYHPEAYGRAYLSAPQAFFTAITVGALKIALSAIDDETACQARAAMDRCGRAIVQAVQISGEGLNAVSASFDPAESSTAVATAHAMLSLLNVSAALGDGADASYHMTAVRMLNWLKRNWVLGADAAANVDLVRFRSPTTAGPSRTTMAWEQPGHAQIVNALTQAYLMHDVPLSEEIWQMLGQAVDSIVAEQEGGFWMDIGLRDKVQTSNTATCAMALARYLGAVRKFLS